MRGSKIKSLRGGLNQQGQRDLNERLLLTLIQRNGPLPGSVLAKASGLSAQSCSVILRRLEQDGLLERGEPQRGRVGKPTVPMGLAADGVLSVGLKIGRRAADLALVDFQGTIRARVQRTYRYPVPDEVFDFLRAGLETLQDAAGPNWPDRVAGIGVATPYELWNWTEVLGIPAGDMAAWRNVDFTREIAAFSPLTVYVQNDATAACRAEHLYGRGSEFRDYAYFHVGVFFGGGVVLDNSVYAGSQENAGAFGPLPVAGEGHAEGQRLIDTASIHLLETAIEARGGDPDMLWTVPQDWTPAEAEVGPWVEAVGGQLARAAVAACSVIDFQAVLIDGDLPARVRERLVDRAARALNGLDLRGLCRPEMHAGTVGPDAGVLGAASAPILAQCFLDTSLGRAVA